MPGPVLQYASAGPPRATVPHSAIACIFALSLLAAGLLVLVLAILGDWSVAGIALAIVCTPFPAAAIALTGMIVRRRWVDSISLASLACCLQSIAWTITARLLLGTASGKNDYEERFFVGVSCAMLLFEAALVVLWSAVANLIAERNQAWSVSNMQRWQRICLLSVPKATASLLIVLGITELLFGWP